MATWGGSTPCRLDDEEDSYASDVEAEEEEEEESGEESSYTDDMHVYPRKQQSYSSKKTRNRSVRGG